MTSSLGVATLYLSHITELRRFLSCRVSCPAVADDLAHETFVRFLSSTGNHQVLIQPRAFLFKIARNLLIDHYRQAQTQNRVLISLDDCEELASTLPSAERIVLAREQIALVRLAVDALPERSREVFLLYKFDGVPQKELARQFGVTLNAIEKLLIRALLTLRQKIGD